MSDNSFPFFPIPTHRDLRIFQLNNTQVLIIGCDSCGGIGPKPLDKLKVDGYTLGKFTARVALMEVVSTGAKPICITDNLSVELDPTGLEILKGVRNEAVIAGLDPNLAVTGSAEKNFAVEQTGLGITVIGISDKNNLRIGTSKTGDALLALGKPCVGVEVLTAEAQHSICTTSDLNKLLSLDFIHEIIPVGSEGIKREVEVLAESSTLRFIPNKTCTIDFEKTGGPATVLLASLPINCLNQLKAIFDMPLSHIGRFVDKK